MKALRFTVPGFAILAVIAFLMQLDKPSVISAKSVLAGSFSVQNASGDMSAGSDGSPSIFFLDANKKIRLVASVGVSGPSVSLLDPEQVALSLNDRSDPSLTMSNADKHPRSVFAIDKGGSGIWSFTARLAVLTLRPVMPGCAGRHRAARRATSCSLPNDLTQAAEGLIRNAM